MKLHRLIACMMAMALVLALAGCGGSGSAPSQSPASSGEAAGDHESGDWAPVKPVTFYVGNAAGGGADLFARQIAKIINDNGWCPQPIIVENKPGGSHTIMFAWLSEQKGDEYALGTVSASYYTMPAADASPVSPDDFATVALFCTDPNLLVVPANSPFDTFEELVEYARENPRMLKYAGSGPYSDDAIICQMINEMCGVQIEYVPFTAGSDILAACLGGHVNMGALGVDEASEHALNGDLKILATSSFDRLDALPDVPTYIEMGYEIDQMQNRGMVMQKDVPDEVREYYSDLMKKVAQSPEWKQYLEENCMVDMFMDCYEYQEYTDEIYSQYDYYIDMIIANEA